MLHQPSASVRDREESKRVIYEDAEGEENVMSFPQEPITGGLRQLNDSTRNNPRSPGKSMTSSMRPVVDNDDVDEV